MLNLIVSTYLCHRRNGKAIKPYRQFLRKTMDTHKHIESLVLADGKIKQTKRFLTAYRVKDRNHLQRRQQQRAISDSMIEVALMYGKKRYNQGALLYTLSDRTLKQSPYAQLTDKLRGLTVVCVQGCETPHVLTAYWHKAICRRVRK
jgi:hypothetical protein